MEHDIINNHNDSILKSIVKDVLGKEYIVSYKLEKTRRSVKRKKIKKKFSESIEYREQEGTEIKFPEKERPMLLGKIVETISSTIPFGRYQSKTPPPPKREDLKIRSDPYISLHEVMVKTALQDSTSKTSFLVEDNQAQTLLPLSKQNTILVPNHWPPRSNSSRKVNIIRSPVTGSSLQTPQ